MSVIKRAIMLLRRARLTCELDHWPAGFQGTAAGDALGRYFNDPHLYNKILACDADIPESVRSILPSPATWHRIHTAPQEFQELQAKMAELQAA